MDHRAGGGKGHHAIGHIEEEGIQLIALILHLGQRLLELLRHGVEGSGQNTDLIPGGHLQLVGEVPLGHPLGTLGQAFNGNDHGLGHQEGEKHRDHQSEKERFDDQINEGPIQV